MTEILVFNCFFEISQFFFPNTLDTKTSVSFWCSLPLYMKKDLSKWYIRFWFLWKQQSKGHKVPTNLSNAVRKKYMSSAIVFKKITETWTEIYFAVFNKNKLTNILFLPLDLSAKTISQNAPWTESYLNAVHLKTDGSRQKLKWIKSCMVLTTL